MGGLIAGRRVAVFRDTDGRLAPACWSSVFSEFLWRMIMPILTRTERVNECDVWILEFHDRLGRKVGHMYRTKHPKIPFEVFSDNLPRNARKARLVHSADEAEAWLMEIHGMRGCR